MTSAIPKSGSAGVTPQEAALASYNVGQGGLQGATTGTNTGMGMSTNETMMSTVGPTFGGALEESQIADSNLASQNSLQQLASSLGQGNTGNAAFGAGAGGGSNFGATPS